MCTHTPATFTTLTTLALLVALPGCAELDPAAPEGARPDTVQDPAQDLGPPAPDAPEDARELRVEAADPEAEPSEARADIWSRRTPGATLWFEPALRWRDRGGAPIEHVLRGRADAPLASIRASRGRAQVLGSSRFEVGLEEPDLRALLRGEALVLELTRRGGEELAARLELGARFVRFEGSRSLWLERGLTPVLDRGQVVLRGRLTVGSWHDELTALTDDDADPTLTREGTRRWRLEWRPGALWLASWPEDPVTVTAWRGDEIYARKRAWVAPAVRRAYLTARPAPQGWAGLAPCRDEVRACLAALPAPSLDTEPCGSARQTRACWPDAHRFAQDLRAHLVAHYQHSARDGAPSLHRLQQAVDPALVAPAPPSSELPAGLDPAAHLLLSHPDPSSTSSQERWLGVYRRADGGLAQIVAPAP